MDEDEPKLEDVLAENERLRSVLAGEDVDQGTSKRAGFYAVAVIALSSVGIVAVTMIFLVRPEADHTSIIAAMLGFLVPTVSAFIAMSVRELNRGVNGRFSQLLRLTRMASRAEGVLIAERRSGRDRRKTP